jgi:UDP-3-O-[3-hydroxymyristoyl] glucosamine N-acyltransferase LpxD
MYISDILQFMRDKGVPYSFSGDETEEVEYFSALNNYKPGSFTWISSQKNIPEGLDLSALQLVIASEGVTGNFRNVIYTPRSKYAFFSTMEHFYAKAETRPAIGQFTYLSPQVKLGKDVYIGHNCTLDGEITIGDGTVIENGVTIENRVSVGKNCVIQSGCRMGGDGFAYSEDEDHIKTMVKHFGGIVIGDEVYIGANCVIDRSEIDDTIIESGCKLDPLSHVAHNVHLEKNCTVISCSNLMGSVHAGENAYISTSIVRNQCHIGKNATVGMGAVVVKDVLEGATVVGNPARPFGQK